MVLWKIQSLLMLVEATGPITLKPAGRHNQKKHNVARNEILEP